MDLSNLENTLRAIIDPSSPEQIRLQESLNKHAQELGWEYVEAFLYHDLSEKVKKELESLSLYQNYEGLFVNQENGSFGFHPFMVAPDLVHISFKKGAEAAISYFDKMTRLPSADGYAINLLLGIDVDNSFELIPGVNIVKIDNVPESNTKDHYLGSESKWHFNNPYSDFIGMPKCALVKKVRIEPLLFKNTDKPNNEKPLQNSELFKEIAFLLTLVGPSPVLTSLYWFSFEDTDLQGAKGGDVSWHNHEMTPFRILDGMPIATKVFSEIVSAYYALKDIKTKKRILISLERLSFSLRRRSSGDAALELSISLETLFAEDYGENTYKIGLRVALLIGVDFDQRKRIRSVISALYKQRSQLVHGGESKNRVTPKGFEPIESKELINEASGYVARSIETIIKLGSIPDWNEFELKKQ